MFTFNEALGKKPPGKEPSGRIAGTFKIQKSVDEKRLAFGWASVAATAAGDTVTDYYEDIIEPDELEQAAYNFVQFYREGGISIHALREEGDSKNREKTLCFCLIIHLPAQIAKRRLQTKPQNHTVTCANGWYSGAKRPGKPCALPVRTGGASKDQHTILRKLRVQPNMLDLSLVIVAQLVEP